jgi:hypothetical protein
LNREKTARETKPLLNQFSNPLILHCYERKQQLDKEIEDQMESVNVTIQKQIHEASQKQKNSSVLETKLLSSFDRKILEAS